MSEVFISYVTEDRTIVERIAQELKRRGADVWLDRDQLEPGVHWKIAIRNAIENGKFFLACFSRASRARRKTFMNEELIIAIDELRKLQFDAVFFIPVLLEECDVPAISIGAGRTLLDLQWVALYENWDEGINKISRIVIDKKKMHEEIKELAIYLAERHQYIKKRVKEEIYFKTARDMSIRSKIIESTPLGYNYTYTDKDYRTSYDWFVQLDKGVFLHKEQKYDNLRKEYKRRFHEEYSPLQGRIEGQSAHGITELNLTVDGVGDLSEKAPLAVKEK